MFDYMQHIAANTQVRRCLVTMLCLATSVALLVGLPAAAQAAWLDPIRVSDDLVDNSSAIGVADDGTTTVMWTTPSGPDPGQVIRLARISASGTVGTPIDIVRADERFTIHDPALGVGADGTAVVAWSDYTTNPSRVSAVRISPDNQLGTPRVIATPAFTNQPVAGTRVAVDPQGTATVVWYRDVPDASTSVVEAVRLPALGPAEPVRVLGSTYGHLYPSIAAQRDGRVLVAWSAGFDRPQFTTISAAGAQGALQDLDTTAGTQTDIVSAPNGAATVAWLHSADNSLHARRVDPDGALGPNVQLSTTDEQVAQYRLAVTNSGVSTALWTDRSDLRIGHILADGKTVAPRTISTAPTGYTSTELALSVDNVDNAQGAWIGADNRLRARRIPFGAPPEATRTLSQPSSNLTRDPVSVTAPSGMGTTMWLDSNSETQQLYIAPSSSGVLDEPATPTCAAVKLIGVAGSGENGGPGTNEKPKAQFGPTVDAFYKALSEQTQLSATSLGSKNTLERHAIDYRAVPVGWQNAIRRRNTADAYADTGNYRASVNEGVAELERVLKAEAQSSCAEQTRYVIAGYSQGAQVIGDLIERNLIPAAFSARITSIVLFGDPKFNSDAHRVIARSSFDPATNGQLRPRAAISFDNLSSKTRLHSYCRELDPVCQAVLRLDTTPHFAYKEAETHWGAWNTAQLLFPTGISRNWAPTLSAKLIERNGRYYVRLTCQVPARGVCHVRANVAFKTIGQLSTSHQGLRYVGRANTGGNLVAELQLSESNGRPSIRSAEADVTATGIAARHSEQTSGQSVHLR